MKLIATATFLAFAVLAVAASASAQEASEEGSNLTDPAASVQAMVEASVAGRPVLNPLAVEVVEVSLRAGRQILMVADDRA